MHKTIGEAAEFIEELRPKAEGANCSVWIAPPFTALAACVEMAKGSSIAIGAQTMSDLEEGARTGEISVGMIREAGASFVILGHSERRTYFGETNQIIRQKVLRAIASKMPAILCVGETEAERESGDTAKVLSTQINECLEGVSSADLENLVIAYEPVWAIGTGKSATAEMAQQAHEMIQAEAIAQNLPILYGGSVKPSNVNELLSQPSIDGALIGGASLDVESFGEMIHQVQNL